MKFPLAFLPTVRLSKTLACFVLNLPLFRFFLFILFILVFYSIYVLFSFLVERSIILKNSVLTKDTSADFKSNIFKWIY